MTFSISVPVGAYHPFLPLCLESLKRQTAPLEVAFLDASDDPRVKAIADDYAELFAYRRHGPDGGQAAAILEGWENTSGDVLGWLNADDLLFPAALDRAAAELDSAALDVVYGHSTILDERGRMTGYHWSVEPPGDRLLESGTISQPSCFFRRAAYDAAGGMNPDLHYTMDWELFIRIYKSGARFGFIDAPLSLVLWGADTKTASFNARRRQELKDIIATHAPIDKQRRIFRSFAIQNILERLRPDWVKQAITRVLVRGRKVVYGLAADGAIADSATLHLVHYETAPKAGASLLFEDASAVDGVMLDGAPVETLAEGAALRIVFPEPVQAGEARRVEIRAAPGKTARFLHCAWTGEFG